MRRRLIALFFVAAFSGAGAAAVAGARAEKAPGVARIPAIPVAHVSPRTDASGMEVADWNREGVPVETVSRVDISRLTDRVVDAIDRRLTAHRERMRA